MLTAIDDEHTQVTSFDEQADDYITKPFSMVLLGRRITALLRRSGKGVTLDITPAQKCRKAGDGGKKPPLYRYYVEGYA